MWQRYDAIACLRLAGRSGRFNFRWKIRCCEIVAMTTTADGMDGMACRRQNLKILPRLSHEASLPSFSHLGPK